MEYEIYFTKDFLKSVEKFPSDQRKIIFNKIEYLKNNIGRNSLRIEKLFKGTKDETRSSSISMGIRLIWRLDGKWIEIVDVGGHDIYRRYGGKS